MKHTDFMCLLQTDFNIFETIQNHHNGIIWFQLMTLFNSNIVKIKVIMVWINKLTFLWIKLTIYTSNV